MELFESVVESVLLCRITMKFLPSYLLRPSLVPAQMKPRSSCMRAVTVFCDKPSLIDRLLNCTDCPNKSVSEKPIKRQTARNRMRTAFFKVLLNEVSIETNVQLSLVQNMLFEEI